MAYGDARDMCHTGRQECEEMRFLYRMLKLDEHNIPNFIMSLLDSGSCLHDPISAGIGVNQCCNQGCRSASWAVNLSSGSRRRRPPMKSAISGSNESKMELRLDFFGLRTSTLCTDRTHKVITIIMMCGMGGTMSYLVYIILKYAAVTQEVPF